MGDGPQLGAKDNRRCNRLGDHALRTRLSADEAQSRAMRKGDAVPDMTKPTRFDNDRTAMLVEALREAERALATVVEGDPMGVPKNTQCRHGRYTFEGCEACTDAVLDPALEAVRSTLRAQEAHGGEHYPDIQRLHLGKQED